jgi:hypothetical protein
MFEPRNFLQSMSGSKINGDAPRDNTRNRSRSSTSIAPTAVSNGGTPNPREPTASLLLGILARRMWRRRPPLKPQRSSLPLKASGGAASVTLLPETPSLHFRPNRAPRRTNSFHSGSGQGAPGALEVGSARLSRALSRETPRSVLNRKPTVSSPCPHCLRTVNTSRLSESGR